MSRAQPGGIAALISDYRRFAGRRLWLSFALMLLGAVAEGFGLLMIVPIAAIAMGSATGISGFARFAPLPQSWTTDQRFMIALALFVAAMAARSLLLVARDTSLVRLEADYEASLRLRSAATLARRGWPFASSVGQAGMQSLLLNDVPRSAQAVGFVQSIAVGASMLLVQLAIALLLSPPLTVVALIFLVLGGLISMRFARRGAVSGLAIVDAMEESAGSGFRLHAGLKAAIAQGTVAAFLAEYRSALLRGARQSTVAARDYSLAQQLTTFGGALVVSVLLLVGVRVLALPFAVLVTSLVIFARMSGPGQLVQNSIVRAAAFSPAFTAIERRLGKLDWNVPDQRARDPVDWNELRLEAVRLEHQPGLGVGGVSLTLKPGEWLGISGASGAGKTTLVDLAAGLLVPESGQVTVDGRALAGATLDGWSATLAYAGQEGSVFNDSVRGNLLAEGASASDTDLWQALETVGLAARVRAFPNDLDHPVGDRGSHLSGGERQRLVLARALLRRPTFLILDEATAALDPESEGALIDRLKALQPKPAALVVAHRASTLTHCDSVLSIQHGVVSADA